MKTQLQELLDRVYEKCIPNGECMDWTGATQSKCMSPSIRKADGGYSVSLRRYMVEIAQGKKPFASRVVTYNCGNSKCVRLEHIGEVTRGTLQERSNSKFNAMQRLLKATRISVKARARAKLTLEIVQEIKASNDSQRVIAAKYGVVQSTVSQIKRGITWQDYSNPFLRLAA
jgi:predicted XRE-type DNA-binding protein